MTFQAFHLFAATHVDELLMPYREPVVEPERLSIYWWILMPFVAAAVILILAHVFQRRIRAPHSQDDLVRKICYAHRIDSAGRELLNSVAEKAELERPATMFLSPQKFDLAVHLAAQKTTFNRHEQATLRTLRRQFFSLLY